MHTPRWRFHSFLLVAFAAALAACGGPTGPAVPNASALTPGTAERGDSVTITGSGFGTTPGSVTIGGEAATTTAWTDTSITATVPAGATNAWHDVGVTTAGGSDTLDDALFVGVEFDGTSPELQPFLDALEPGTAVLLQAETYDLTAQVEPFVVDNIDLHGRGSDQTFITPPGSGQTYTLAEFGGTTTFSDLSLEFATFVYLHGTFRDTVTPWAAATLEPAFMAGESIIDSERVAALVEAALLQPAAANPGRLLFDGVTFTAAGPAVWGVAIMNLPSVDLVFRDSSFDAPAGGVSFVTTGDVLIESSVLDVEEVLVLSPFGEVSVVDSEVTTSDSATLGAQAGLLVDASTVTVEDGNLAVIGAAAVMMGGSSIPSGGAVELSGSTIAVLDSDLLDATDNGALDIITQYAPIRLIDNVLIRTHDTATLVVLDSQLGEGDIDIIGNLDVRIGVTTAESAAGARSASLVAATNANSSVLRNRVTAEGSTIAATETVAFVPNDVVDVHVTGNTISAGDAGLTGAVTMLLSGEGEVEVTGNDFTFRSSFNIQAADLAGGTLVVADNSFTNVTETPGIVQVVGSEGSCSITENVFVLDDPSDTNTQGVISGCVSTVTDYTFTVSGNDVTATGAPTSGVSVVSSGVEQLTFNDNVLSIDDSFTVTSTAPDAEVSGNTVAMGSGSFGLYGSPTTTLTVNDNTVTQRSPVAYGLHVSGVSSATATGNSFTGLGVPGANATAFRTQTGTGPMALTVTGNTFTNYSNALHLTDAAVTAHGYTGAINGNVFDFVIDAAPKVATLTNIASAINATNNQWGSNTSAATLQGYVTLAGDTGGQGGSINLSPITQP